MVEKLDVIGDERLMTVFLNNGWWCYVIEKSLRKAVTIVEDEVESIGLEVAAVFDGNAFYAVECLDEE